MLVDFAGAYDADQIREADALIARAYRKEAPSTNLGCLFLSGFMTVALFYTAASAGHVAAGVQWAVLGTCVTGFFAWKVHKSRQSRESNPLIGRNAHGSISDDRISISIAGKSLDRTWSAFVACRATDRAIVLFPNKQEYILLPADFFRVREDFQSASRVCSNSIRRKSPMPLVNWRALFGITAILVLVLIVMTLLGRQ